MVLLRIFIRICMVFLLNSSPIITRSHLSRVSRIPGVGLPAGCFSFNSSISQWSTRRAVDIPMQIPRPPDNPEVTMVEACTSLTDLEFLARAQMRDPQLATLKLQLQNSTVLHDCSKGLHKCFLQDGLICRTYKDSTTQLEHTQVVIPSTLKNMVLQEVHNHLGHFGTKKTLERLKARYYWPGYEQDTVQWVKQCEQCQKSNPPQPNPVAPCSNKAL